MLDHVLWESFCVYRRFPLHILGHFLMAVELLIKKAYDPTELVTDRWLQIPSYLHDSIVSFSSMGIVQKW